MRKRHAFESHLSKNYAAFQPISFLLFLWATWIWSVSGDAGGGRQLAINGLRGTGLAATSSKSSSRSRLIATTNSKNLPTANVTVDLHAHSGTHHVHVYVGSPPQRQTLIVDTGSRLMAFPCRPCRGCGTHASPYFDLSISTTYQTPKCGSCQLRGISTCSLFHEFCTITQTYTEGSSWTATEVQDLVWFGTSDVTTSVEEHMQLAVPMSFGCQTTIKGLFKRQYADGILGLGRHDTSIIQAYYDAQAISHNAFSLCLTRDGGYLNVGGSLSPSYHVEPMISTPISREHGLYSIEVIQIQVGTIVIANEHDTNTDALRVVNGGKGCILDSGTTDTYMPLALAKALQKAALEESSGVSDLSGKRRTKGYSHTDFLKLPSITFTFANNATLVVPPSNYMEDVPLDDRTGQASVWSGNKPLTNRLYFESTEGLVLGANAMFGYDILFDTQNNQVGIAKANCWAQNLSTTSVTIE